MEEQRCRLAAEQAAEAAALVTERAAGVEAQIATVRTPGVGSRQRREHAHRQVIAYLATARRISSAQDHHHPHTHGGPTSITNARGLCAWCNHTKADRPPTPGRPPTPQRPPDRPPTRRHRRRPSRLERRARRHIRIAIERSLPDATTSEPG